MNTSIQAQELLSAYGQLAGMPGLKFEPHGCARLLFDKSIAIDLEIDEEAGCIQVYGVLGVVPSTGREALYRRLLEGNLFGTQTGGAALAIDPVQDEVLLCRRVDLATTNAVALTECLETFAGLIEQWQRRLASGELVVPPRDGVAAPEGMGMFLRA
jgi:hypothetical protein